MSGRMHAGALLVVIFVSGAAAAPAPDVAKQCLRAAYMLYPYKRPGAGPMNGDRLFYYERCLSNQGNAVPERPAERPAPGHAASGPESR